MTAPTAVPQTPAPTPPPATSAAPTSGTPAAAATSPTPPAAPTPSPADRFPAGPGIPDYLAGKPIAEVAQQFQQLARAASTPPVPTAAAAPAPAPTLPQAPSQQDFLTDPEGATKRYAEYLEATRWQPQFQAQAVSVAQTNRQLVELQRQDDFRRWGPEIDLKLRELAPNPQQWTPQNITAVVDIVRSQHVNELIAEEVDRKLKAQLAGATLRPDGGAGAPGAAPGAAASLDLDKLPPNYATSLKRLGVTAREVDEFLTKTYVQGGLEPSLEAARERWVKQAVRGDIVTDGKEFLSGVYN